MKKNGDKKKHNRNAAAEVQQEYAADKILVFLALAVIILSVDVIFSHHLFSRRNIAPPTEITAEKYIWLKGYPGMAEGVYLFTKQQLDKDFPELGKFLAQEASPGANPIVQAVNFTAAADLQLMPMPPQVANIFLQPIPINRADEDILTSLPGIGPVLAARIVQRREQYGPFNTKEELLQVAGIGPKKFAALIDHVTLD